ncbi:24393_t:CDS:1, partial [Dentiscutata erythropus]
NRPNENQDISRLEQRNLSTKEEESEVLNLAVIIKKQTTFIKTHTKIEKEE